MNFYYIINFDKHDKRQLLAKFKENSVGGVLSHLEFSKLCNESENNLFTNGWTVF